MLTRAEASRRRMQWMIKHHPSQYYRRGSSSGIGQVTSPFGSGQDNTGYGSDWTGGNTQSDASGGYQATWYGDPVSANVSTANVPVSPLPGSYQDVQQGGTTAPPGPGQPGFDATTWNNYLDTQPSDPMPSGGTTSSNPLSGIMSWLSGLVGGNSQSYATSQGQPAVTPPTSYGSTQQGTAPTNGSGTPAPPSGSGFQLSSLWNFSTPYPYLAIGGVVLMLAITSKGKSGSGSGGNFIKL